LDFNICSTFVEHYKDFSANLSLTDGAPSLHKQTLCFTKAQVDLSTVPQFTCELVEKDLLLGLAGLAPANFTILKLFFLFSPCFFISEVFLFTLCFFFFRGFSFYTLFFLFPRFFFLHSVFSFSEVFLFYKKEKAPSR